MYLLLEYLYIGWSDVAMQRFVTDVMKNTLLDSNFRVFRRMVKLHISEEMRIIFLSQDGTANKAYQEF